MRYFVVSNYRMLLLAVVALLYFAFGLTQPIGAEEPPKTPTARH